ISAVRRRDLYHGPWVLIQPDTEGSRLLPGKKTKRAVKRGWIEINSLIHELHLNYLCIELARVGHALHEEIGVSGGHAYWIGRESGFTRQGYKQQVDFIGEGVAAREYIFDIFVGSQVLLLLFLFGLRGFKADKTDLLHAFVQFAQLCLL